MDTETTSDNGAALFFCRLSLERCGVYLAHLCAGLHMAGAEGDRLLEIAAGLERELTASRGLLPGQDMQ